MTRFDEPQDLNWPYNKPPFIGREKAENWWKEPFTSSKTNTNTNQEK